MSRTIRRTKTTKPYSRLEWHYTHVRLEEYLDVVQGFQYRIEREDGMPLVPREDFKIVWWKFHSDNGLPSFGWEEAYERPYRPSEGAERRRYQQELHRWLKDPDHEIQLTKPKLIYDLC